MADPPSDVARMLRQARLSAGLTQVEIARRAGLHQSVVSKYEQGVREPSAGRMLRLLSAADDTASPLAPPQGGSSDGRSSSVGDVLPTTDTIASRVEIADPPSPTPDPKVVSDLRSEVKLHLAKQGFQVTPSGVLATVGDDKDQLRELHTASVETQRLRARPALASLESRFVERLATGTDVDPTEIRPRMVLVEDRRGFEGKLWRWCSLHWSIPVSSGYGRRLRFLVVDEGHGDSVMGLIGLGDPVFALGCRDAMIGWTREQRAVRLSSVMDAFVLGAVPPYNNLLAGKLMALLTGAEEVRSAFSDRYGHRTTLIAQRDPRAELALVTTTSALGRSSVYNRLRRADGSLALVPVGYTGGSGDFHLSGEIYTKLADFARSYAKDKPPHRHERWGNPGFRNRREVIQKGLDALGMDSRALRSHGVRRQVFLHELAENTNEYLRGETDEVQWRPDTSAEALAAWWRTRWALPRSHTDKRWLASRPPEWRLYG